MGRTICGGKCAGKKYICTLDPDHSGRHEAWGGNGTMCHWWYEGDNRPMSGSNEERLERTIREAVSLLNSAKCPEPDCDGNGTITRSGNGTDPEYEQCEWCCRRQSVLYNQNF